MHPTKTNPEFSDFSTNDISIRPRQIGPFSLQKLQPFGRFPTDFRCQVVQEFLHRAFPFLSFIEQDFVFSHRPA